MNKHKQHGGKREGSGRKPGADWNGSGHYEHKVKRVYSITPANYDWLRSESKHRGVSMAQLVNEAIEQYRTTPPPATGEQEQERGEE